MNRDHLKEKEYREAFVDAMIRTGIAFQVKELRNRRQWSQKVLGERVGTSQNVISRYEDPDYGAFTLKTLQKLASAFDVALIVKFAPFSELLRLTLDRSPESLAVQSFSEELPTKKATEIDHRISTGESVLGQGTNAVPILAASALAGRTGTQALTSTTGFGARATSHVTTDGYSNANR